MKIKTPSYVYKSKRLKFACNEVLLISCIGCRDYSSMFCQANQTVVSGLTLCLSVISIFYHCVIILGTTVKYLDAIPLLLTITSPTFLLLCIITY